MIRNFSVYGLIFEISINRQIVLDFITSALKTYDMVLMKDDPGESHVSIHLETTSEAPITPSGYEPLSHIGCLDVSIKNSKIYVTDGFSFIEIDSETNHASGVLNESMWSDVSITNSENLGVLMYSIAVLLGYNNLFLLHSASLVHNSNGYLFLGHSGSGKSTTTLGLIANGWKVLSDDTVLIKSYHETVECISFRKDMYLKEDTVKKFPWIADHCEPARLPGRKKQRILLKDLFEDQFQNSCAPNHLIFLSVCDIEKSTLTMMSKSEAFFSLLEQCPFVSIETRFAAIHMECLRKLLNQSIWYQLQLGKDLKDDPCKIAEILKPIVCETHE